MTTSNGELTAIMKDVRDEWWRGGWDKHAELAAFIEKHESDKTACATAQFYIGANFYADKNYEQAVTEFGKVISQYPGAAECAQAQYEMGYAYEHLKSWDDAVWAYNETAANYGACEWVVKALFRLGQCHQRKKDYALAIETYARLLKDHAASPEAPQALIKTGYCHRMLKQPEQELAAYEWVLAEYGSSKQAAEAKLKIGMIHRESRQYDDEVDAYQAVAVEYSESEPGKRAKVKIGDHHSRAGRWVDAIETWEELVGDTRSASAPVASLKIARTYADLGEGEYAMLTYRRVMRDYPGSSKAARALVEIGRCYRQIGENDSATQCFNDVIANLSKHRRPVIESHIELGDMALTSGTVGTVEDGQSAYDHYREAYQIRNYDLPLMKKLIERVARMMEVLDGSDIRARQFLEFQLYGPGGRDGESGTADDLYDPLCQTTQESDSSAALYSLRMQKLSAAKRESLRDFLLRSLGRESEVADADAAELSACEQIMGGDGDLAEKMQALREYSKLKRNQKRPIARLSDDGSVLGELDARMRRYSEIVEWSRRISADHISEDTQTRQIVMIEAEARQMMASAHAAQGDLNLAIYEYESLLDIAVPEPMKAFFKHELGKLCFDAGNIDGAMTWYERIIEDHAGQPDALAAAKFALAQHHGRTGDKYKRMALYKEIVENYPQTAWAARAKHELDLLEGITPPDDADGMPIEVHYVKDDMSAYVGKRVEFSSTWGEFKPSVVETTATGTARTRFYPGDQTGEVTIRIEMETGDVIIRTMNVVDPTKLRGGL